MSETAAVPPTEAPATPPPAEAAAAAPPSLVNGSPPPAETAEQAEARQRKPDGKFAPKVPEKYEFAAPEVNGKALEVDPEALTGFETAARDAGLTQEQFAKIAPLGAQMIAAKVQAAVAASMPEYLRPERQAAWRDAVLADPDIGGDKLGPALGQAARAIEQFGGKDLRDALDMTRAGNNPAIVKAFIAIGKAMGDGQGFHTGRPAIGAKPASQEQAARDFYNKNGGAYPPVEG